ncbi:NUDIX hydrolase N-terminal domain-containing protein [Streptococcus catagoni]|uniref:NUDIX hydrolase N-terminal domain-containing protein n=1 Tax=Streptococcus catagoni TaxID=2654874 RepID=UPI00140E7CE7|nr:NUDIX hydrolase [Streptococcus catagoni]
MSTNDSMVKWAIELQSLAQAGLSYGRDIFDIERYERIRAISAEMMAAKTDMSIEVVRSLFCNETGYQTPKLDTRAAIFKEDKILLVQEKDHKWSLPGGWVDVDVSVKENTIKEVKEEAGLDVSADKIIAVQDRAKHNLPVYAHNICKIFVLCSEVGGQFEENSETIDSGYFSEDCLPELATAKNTVEQIKMCFKAYRDPQWQTFFD